MHPPPFPSPSHACATIYTHHRNHHHTHHRTPPQSPSIRAGAGQCSNEYVTAGIASPSALHRFVFNDNEFPNGSPTWGCDVPDNNRDTGLCAAQRAAYSTMRAFEGEIGGSPGTLGYGARTEPALEPWLMAAWLRVVLDRDYADGEAAGP